MVRGKGAARQKWGILLCVSKLEVGLGRGRTSPGLACLACSAGLPVSAGCAHTTVAQAGNRQLQAGADRWEGTTSPLLTSCLLEQSTHPCMRALSPVQDDDARHRVETEMEAGAETRAILDALHATRASGGC